MQDGSAQGDKSQGQDPESPAPRDRAEDGSQEEASTGTLQAESQAAARVSHTSHGQGSVKAAAASAGESLWRGSWGRLVCNADTWLGWVQLHLQVRACGGEAGTDRPAKRTPGSGGPGGLGPSSNLNVSFFQLAWTKNPRLGLQQGVKAGGRGCALGPGKKLTMAA